MPEKASQTLTLPCIPWLYLQRPGNSRGLQQALHPRARRRLKNLWSKSHQLSIRIEQFTLCLLSGQAEGDEDPKQATDCCTPTGLKSCKLYRGPTSRKACVKSSHMSRRSEQALNFVSSPETVLTTISTLRLNLHSQKQTACEKSPHLQAQTGLGMYLTCIPIWLHSH